uniref:DUF559 domain-containing protein n=2 Tax=Prevotella sp. TaxID=59823 RepID=UPI004027D5F3
MEKGISQEIKERVEAIEGMNILDAAKFRYVTEQRSFRWLVAYWKVNGRTVHRILSKLGIPIRHGSAAVRVQWIGAEERRKDAAKRLAQTNHELAAKGLHVRQGKTKENSGLIRDISNKLKRTSSLLRPSVRKNAIENSLATRKLHPERMSALGLPLSESEEIMRSHLLAMGFPFEVRKLIGGYVVDFFIKELRLVIDCQGRNRFPLSYTRHQCIAKEGICVAYCVNEQVKRRTFTDLDNYISLVKVFRSDPSSPCAEAVIWGACGFRPFGDDSYKVALKRTGKRGCYLTELSTSSDY